MIRLPRRRIPPVPAVLVDRVRERWEEARALWRRSLQVRVVASTLVLSSTVVLVLGMVLETQIADRLLQAKTEAALAQAESSTAVVEGELGGVDPSDGPLAGQLTNAVDRLTSPGTGDEAAVTSGAGVFEPVLVDGEDHTRPDGGQAVGPVGDVPPELRRAVLGGQVATKITKVSREGAAVSMLAVGMPVRSAGRGLQLYLLFPLTAEQRTLNLVQNTLVVGGLVLLGLVAGIASLVARQVVTPVRQAAEVAERFADGRFEERMAVSGEDDIARLAVSFNEMAASIERQIRQLEELGALQRRFTSDVSHELRTPLTTVRMAADLLHGSREEMPPALSRSTELLVTELDRFESLLGDLLEISRLDAGVAELYVESVDLIAVLRRAVDAVRALAEGAGSPVDLVLPGGGVTVEVDPRRVERILRNLMSNALDHGEGRPVQVWVAADEHVATVLVRDHGVGLRPGEEELVFNRFWRADTSRNRRTGGTGLGLAIALEDARLHDGRLDAWGEPGRGAAFRLTLPRVRGGQLSASPLPLVPPDALVDRARAQAHRPPAPVLPGWAPGRAVAGQQRDPDQAAGEPDGTAVVPAGPPGPILNSGAGS